jgi:hypothetical protein
MKKELYIASRIHRRESLPQQSPGKSEQSRKNATSSAPSEDYLLPAGSRGSDYPENSAVHFFYGKWTQVTRKKEANEVKDRQAALQVSPPSKENRKKLVTTTVPFYRRPLYRGKSGIYPRLRR